MKKLISFASAICLLTASLPFTAAAKEYEAFPKYDGTGDKRAHYSEIAKGIEEGRYFADFNGNGKIDRLDSFYILTYYVEKQIGQTLEWDNRKGEVGLSIFDIDYCVKNYESSEHNGSLSVLFDLDNKIYENVEKYGDVNGDGLINSYDAAEVGCLFLYTFDEGDIDMDEKVDASDASKVLSYYSETMTGTEHDADTVKSMKILGDLDGNGVVDASDACKILEIYSKSMTSK